MATLRRHFANINLRIKVGGKGMAVVTAVDIDDIEFMNFIEVVLGDIGGKDIGRAGVEPAA